MEIIPAIDIIDGKCVRLTQGNYSQCKIYSESPLKVAQAFEETGFTRLHLVDLDGAKSGKVVNFQVLEAICRNTCLTVDFGGGIKSDADIQCVFDAGAALVCIGSIAQTDPLKTMGWMDTFGPENIIVGADVWNTKICIQGWKKVTETSIYDLVEGYGDKLRHLMCTDIARDGMLDGPSLELYADLLCRYPQIHLIASGGVGGYSDLEKLKNLGVKSVIVGKAIYEKKVEPAQLVRM